MVICNVLRCPFRSLSGFCQQKVVNISEHGMCRHIYNVRG
jgi:hypothetical protein